MIERNSLPVVACVEYRNGSHKEESNRHRNLHELSLPLLHESAIINQGNASRPIPSFDCSHDCAISVLTDDFENNSSSVMYSLSHDSISNNNTPLHRIISQSNLEEVVSYENLESESNTQISPIHDSSHLPNSIKHDRFQDYEDLKSESNTQISDSSHLSNTIEHNELQYEPNYPVVSYMETSKHPHSNSYQDNYEEYSSAYVIKLSFSIKQQEKNKLYVYKRIGVTGRLSKSLSQDIIPMQQRLEPRVSFQRRDEAIIGSIKSHKRQTRRKTLIEEIEQLQESDLLPDERQANLVRKKMQQVRKHVPLNISKDIDDLGKMSLGAKKKMDFINCKLTSIGAPTPFRNALETFPSFLELHSHVNMNLVRNSTNAERESSFTEDSIKGLDITCDETSVKMPCSYNINENEGLESITTKHDDPKEISEFKVISPLVDKLPSKDQNENSYLDDSSFLSNCMYYFIDGDVLKPTSLCLSSSHLPEAILNMKVESNEENLECETTKMTSRLSWILDVPILSRTKPFFLKSNNQVSNLATFDEDSIGSLDDLVQCHDEESTLLQNKDSIEHLNNIDQCYDKQLSLSEKMSVENQLANHDMSNHFQKNEKPRIDDCQDCDKMLLQKQIRCFNGSKLETSNICFLSQSEQDQRNQSSDTKLSQSNNKSEMGNYNSSTRSRNSFQDNNGTSFWSNIKSKIQRKDSFDNFDNVLDGELSTFSTQSLTTESPSTQAPSTQDHLIKKLENDACKKDKPGHNFGKKSYESIKERFDSLTGVLLKFTAQNKVNDYD